jgi:hypothetical protein
MNRMGNYPERDPSGCAAGPIHVEAISICTKAVYGFEIEGDAEPNVLALVCNLVSLVNVVPRSSRCYGRRTIERSSRSNWKELAVPWRARLGVE